MDSLPIAPESLPKDKEVVITVHDSSLQASMPSPAEPVPCYPAAAGAAAEPRPSCVGAASRSGDGVRCSMQLEECGMWPARRTLQKRAASKKRLWMWLKIAIGLCILAAAVAVGLGISKAVKDARMK